MIREIKENERFSREEEREQIQNIQSLGTQIAAFQEALAGDFLSPQEKAEISSELKLLERTYDNARSDFLVRNKWLIVRRWYRMGGVGSISDSDFQVGWEKLSLALDRFDLSMGKRFSTYAWSYIHSGIQRNKEKGGDIHIPVHVLPMVHKVRSVIDRLREEGIVPTAEIVAKELCMEVGEASRLLEVAKCVRQSSLDQPMKQGEDSTLVELVAHQAITPEDAVLSGDSYRKAFASLQMILERVRPEDRALLVKRFGLTPPDFSDAAAADVANILGITTNQFKYRITRATRRAKIAALHFVSQNGTNPLPYPLIGKLIANREGADMERVFFALRTFLEEELKTYLSCR